MYIKKFFRTLGSLKKKEKARRSRLPPTSPRSPPMLHSLRPSLPYHSLLPHPPLPIGLSGEVQGQFSSAYYALNALAVSPGLSAQAPRQWWTKL